MPGLTIKKNTTANRAGDALSDGDRIVEVAGAEGIYRHGEGNTNMFRRKAIFGEVAALFGDHGRQKPWRGRRNADADLFLSANVIEGINDQQYEPASQQ
jgi:hypothetical protein